MMDIIFENAINLFQSVVVTVFLMVSLGCKDKYNKKCTGIIGIVITFIYLTVSNHIVYFESVGIYIYMVYSLIFSFVVLGGTIIIEYGTVYRYAGAVLNQLLLVFFFIFLIKIKKLLIAKDNKYMFIMSMIPAISVIVCCFMVYRSDNSYEMNVIYTFIAMAGIIIINVISVFLLIMEQKLYEQKMRQQVMLSAYQQKEKDIESILDMQKQNSKQRHDIKNVLILIRELINDEQYAKATEMLDKYSTGQKNVNLAEIISNNIVLNYLLNRKINECRNNGIDMGCYVLGDITGVDDMDLYILLENLCDNAIEAAAQSNNPTIKLQISEDNGNLCIYIGNTTPGNVLKNNPDMNTTKKDKGMHGFGIMNIRDIIDKYNGTINYEQQGDNYLMCRCRLKKICQ